MNTRTNAFGQPIGPDLDGWAVPPSPPIEVITGTTVTLEPVLDPDDDRRAERLASLSAALIDAFIDAEDSLWTYLPYGPLADVDAMSAVLTALDAPDDWLVYAVVVDGVPLGFCAYLRIAPTAGSIEIGAITLSPTLQRTTAATEALSLLIGRAFELGYRRVEWKCDDLNEPSRRAAERLGFSYEGTFAKATHYKGRSRDTAWFAITDDAWPALHASFTTWLAPDNFDVSGAQRSSLAQIRRIGTEQSATSATQQTPMLFLPGTSGHGSFWDPIRARFDDHPTVALDWPGLGGNSPVPEVSSFDDLVEWTLAHITEPSVLIGQSMGGYVAMRIAIEKPEMVTHLVLAATSAGVDRSRLGLPDWRLEGQPDDPKWVVEQQDPLDEQIRQIRVPTLLVSATADAISPLPLAERLEELISHASLVTYSSDSHWAILDHVEDVAQHIRAMMQLPSPVAEPRRAGAGVQATIRQIVFDARDIHQLATFWSAILGVEITDSSGDWVSLSTTPGTPNIAIQRSDGHNPFDPTSAQHHGRVHLDVVVDDIETYDQLVLEHGGTRLSEHPLADPAFRVYADPAGHLFCLEFSTVRTPT